MAGQYYGKRKKTRIAAPEPAPGELDLVQAFVNTMGRKAKTDALATPQRLSEWLTRRGLLPAGTQLSKADHGRALDVRDGIHELVAARGGAELDERVMARLDNAVRGARPQIRFDRDGTSRFEPQGLDEALGQLIALVVMARLSGLWDRFKVCANPGCRAIFYDHSNKRTTKWCTRRCGDLIRARKYRRGEKYQPRSR